jgi:5'-nucleotidase
VPPRRERATEEIAEAKRAVKEMLDKLRAELRVSIAEHTRLEAELDAAFNPNWGPMFREGYEISKFGEQVEAYACVYTSRVSNFRFYSPNRHFRGPRDRMPHER